MFEERWKRHINTLESLQVLLAEDNAVNRKVLSSILNTLKIKNITVAKNGQEAFDIYTTSHFDLILMDGQMPVMTGIEAARKIRRFEESDPRIKRSPIPIIAITAHAMKEDREMFLKNGMDDYITKPIKRSALMQSILSLTIGNDTSSATNEIESNTIPDPI